MSTVMTGYSNIPTFHPFPDHSNHVHQSAQQQQPSVNHSDPFAMMPHAGPSSQPIQYNQLPTASYPYQASSQPQPQPQPPQFTHSNSAPEIQYYEAPSVFAPPDPASNGFPQLQINHNPFPSSSGQMPAASYVSDYHFGDSPAMPHGSGVGMGQGLPNGYAGPPQGFRGGPLGPPEGDWDDDDTREIEMVYGNLEVSPTASSSGPVRFPSRTKSTSKPKRESTKRTAQVSHLHSRTSPISYAICPSIQARSAAQIRGSTLCDELSGSPSSTSSPDQRAFPSHLPPSSSCKSPSKLSVIVEDVQASFAPQLATRLQKASAHNQVKHRRRTTPDQLKVLEHWFAINPKPDNSLREWLASELGMTKRNVQVWFQNR